MRKYILAENGVWGIHTGVRRRVVLFLLSSELDNLATVLHDLFFLSCNCGSLSLACM